MSTLIAITYDKEETAKQSLAKLGEMQKMQLVSLEDAAVGIGSVARARRRGFVATWQVAYWLEPLAGAALLGRYPACWTLFRQDADGYREVTRFDQRPDADQIDSALHDGAAALGQQIGAMDRFLKDLSG